jgi:hypothetical protein
MGRSGRRLVAFSTILCGELISLKKALKSKDVKIESSKGWKRGSEKPRFPILNSIF